MISPSIMIQAVIYCFKNPSSKAAIVTKDGVYTISFEPTEKFTGFSNYEWVKKFFIDEKNK